ncbi:phosphoribosyltransferase [Porphyromonas circumdentaria]|uniref:Hypoxanthine phosphoribosyltransferase n=1 Tax=Porphyromonas circumdentaria TaxID=29524 RepID=A0A1T4NKF6_9PORP|nr:phosphoribosyltransferase family protein [Porphyromonas circumdentaria]MBB6276112.1 hypoxanthine phosphoribosyltransferase [Porphyromonas circumdentaria]MDO4722759.1 phosphoribosyltransferase family protein [Porphyromonas circumdentaria]SJZ79605.1 hypoxanthine phosphoribosyltransferase [Porphyromonas circumdentaria]
MKTIELNGKVFELYLTYEQIDKAIKDMAARIAKDMEGKDPLYVCIMNGAFMFASELLGYIGGDSEVAFARYSSYQGTQSTYDLREIMPVTTPLKGRTVVILEDLIDTGYTMSCVKELYYNQGASEVFIATMLSKPAALKCAVQSDYVGIEIANDFIVGHGLDFDERGRMLRDIYKIREL